MGILKIEVDHTAPPLHERLELEVVLDDDLILWIRASSSQKKDRASASYYDLEFGLGFPEGVVAGGVGDPKVGAETAAVPASGIVIRANVSQTRDQAVVPGDVLYLHNSSAFTRHAIDGATQAQLLEHLYYQPCAVCKRAWGDPECRCGST